MRRLPHHLKRTPLLGVIALVLVVGACSSDPESAPTTTTDAVDATTSTTQPVRAGLVPDAALMHQANAAGTLASLDLDRYLVSAMWGAFEAIPLEFMVPVDEAPRQQWDHSALTRIIERWDALDVVTRGELVSAVDGLEDFVDRPGFSGARATHEGCVPTATDGVLICVGGSISHQPVPGLPLEEAADIVRPWVGQAAADAWPKFDALFELEPFIVKIYLSNLHADGGFAYGLVPAEQPEGDSHICHAYLDVLVPEDVDGRFVHVGHASVPDGVPLEARIKATTAHEMFHCFQRVNGHNVGVALVEGSATWSEHHVYPRENTEIDWMPPWVSDPDKPFVDRAYDTSFAFLFADQHYGPDAVVDALEAGSMGGLLADEADFASMWHDISLSSWNASPTKPLVNDNDELVHAGVGQAELSSVEIDSESAGTMEFAIPAFSRDIQTFEFRGGTSDEDLTDFARLWLDLTDVPSDVRIAVLTETASGWGGPVDLAGSTEWTFCRVAVGPCNDAEPTTLQPFTRLALIVTNVDNGNESFDIPWNTYNPHLDGTWVRTDGPFLTNPGVTAPYSIVGTTLDFGERLSVMSENSAGYSLANSDPGWECTFAGQYFIGADPAYERPDEGDVDGVVTVDPTVGEGETFTNDCVFGGEGGTNVSGVHFPVVANPTGTFGFEIRDYDTLWIYAFERIYVYERTG